MIYKNIPSVSSGLAASRAQSFCPQAASSYPWTGFVETRSLAGHGYHDGAPSDPESALLPPCYAA